ncbi:MAG: hypothetical protein MUO77_03620 [Anaerolineales bacterium]|nr:hypothetical protein [Anaerolineales bacterium]
MAKQEAVDTMQWWCNECGGDGEISYPDREHARPVYVICAHCSHPDAYVWCEHCEVGGQIADVDFPNHSFFWVCKECKNEYSLPSDFYHNPLVFKAKRNTGGVFGKNYQHVPLTWLRNQMITWKRNIPKIIYIFIFSTVLLGAVIIIQLNFSHLLFRIALGSWLLLASLLFLGTIVLDGISMLFSTINRIKFLLHKNGKEK